MNLSNRKNRNKGRKPEIRAQDGVAEILLYGEIGFFGIGAEEFVREIGRIEASEIRVRINSPGGEVFDGVAIHEAILRHPARVTTHIDGLAASMSSVIAMAGERVVMADKGFLMIHDPWSIVIGNAEDMRREADVLDKVAANTIVSSYIDKTGIDDAEIRRMMRDETWLSASDALELGFIDEIADAEAVEASFDFSRFSNVPSQLRDASGLGPTVAERALRDAGFSRKAAKKLLAEGYTDEVAALCDAEPNQAGMRDAEIANPEVFERVTGFFLDTRTEYRAYRTIEVMRL